ncbi:MAG TPA: MFS transporter [Bauldia sp.]|nr:MFS transporter [Bauldia sp.]
MRLWRVLGVLTLIGAEALLYGYTYPFFSLALEKMGLATWLIGLNASLAGAGILFVGPILPRLIDRFGIRRLVAAQFAISLVSFVAILAANHVLVWFVARFIMGACFASLWTTTEIWLNGVVSDRQRGRIIGASGTLYAACQFLGPVVLGGVGVTGSLPLVVAIIPLAIGVVVALMIPPARGEAEEEESLGDTKSLKLALTLAGALVAAAFLGGIGETAMQALLPLYGLAHGINDAQAAGLVAVFSLGEAVLVAVLGWMADRYGRKFTLLTCSVLATLTCAALPFAVASPFTLFPVLFIAGGAISGIYTLGVILMGQDFRGQKLAYVSTGFAMAYAAGSIAGSTPVGYLIDLFGAEALPVSIAAGFLALTVFLAWPQRHAALDVAPSDIDAERSKMIAEFDGLPDIKFDLSFLFEPPPAELVAAQPAVEITAAEELAEPAVLMEYDGPLPDIQFDLSFLQQPAELPAPPALQPEPAAVASQAPSRERTLEEWFLQRTLEVARYATEREALAHAAA